MVERRNYAAAAAPCGRDVDRCLLEIERTVGEARAAGAELVAFPECSLGGPPAPGTGSPLPPPVSLDGPEVRRLIEISGETVVCLGLSERAAGGVYSTTVCLSGAGIHGTHRKVHIPPAELLAYCCGDGFLAFDTPVGRIGMLNCYDKVFPEAARALALQGAQTIVAMSAWPVSRVRPAADLAADVQSLHFDLMDRARAIENQVVWVSANLSGSWAGLRYLGQSKIVDPEGWVLAATEPGEAGLAQARISCGEAVGESRSSISHLGDRRPLAYTGGGSPAAAA